MLQKFLIQDSRSQSPFVTFKSSGREKYSVTLPNPYIYALTIAVSQLGALKDMGQTIEIIEKAYLESGVAKTSAEAKMAVAKLFPTYPSMEQILNQGKVIYQDLEKNKLLENIIVSLNYFKFL